MPKSRQNTASLLGHQNGRYGMKRITGGPENGEFARVRAVGGSATFGPGTTVRVGDSPSGDTLQQGEELALPFEAVEVSTGTMYAFYEQEPTS